MTDADAARGTSPGVDSGPRPLPFAHIACCIDDSAASRRALAEAARLRALGPGLLTVLHVGTEPMLYDFQFAVVPEVLWAAAHAWLSEQVAGVPGARGELLTGDPPETAVAWAASAQVDLLVAAPHRGLGDRIALGSFASHLVHHAPCPVLLVRPDGSGEAPSADVPYRHIVCCVDLSPAALRALALARELRAVGPGRITALHAAHLPPAIDMGLGAAAIPSEVELVESAAAWLGEAVGRMPEVEVAVIGGAPTWACEEWARRHDCDLMVAAAHRGLVQRVVLGSFAAHLAHHASCSVLIVRPTSAARDS